MQRKIPESLLSVLPFYNYVYSLGDETLDYVDAEKDLGVLVKSSFDWSDQCGKVYSKANQNLGLSRRTCHFLVDERRKRVIYLTMVRSQFEHCSVIWRPLTQTLLKRFEDLQKRAIKWILSEEYLSYSYSQYIQKCRQLNIIPMSDRFDFLDLIFFYKIIKGLIPVELPPYITQYVGVSRLRSSHMDHLCYVSSITPRSANNAFGRSFFYRTLNRWNHIPLCIREIDNINEFKSSLLKHMWKVILSNIDDSDVMFENIDSE